jgi:anti-sigma B factor antagonist
MIQARLVDGTSVVEITAKTLDRQTSQRLIEETNSALEQTRQVIFDLSNLNSLDSSGLGVLLSCLRQVKIAGGDLKLCCLRPAVRAAFLLVQMYRLFAVYNTRDEALRGCKAEVQ